MSGIEDTAPERLSTPEPQGSISDWRTLGAREVAAKRFSAAIAAYQRAIVIDPADADANAQLAHLFEIHHTLEQAKRHAAIALASDGANAVARVALARALLRENDSAGAEAAAMPLAQSQTASRNDRSLAWGVIGDARDLAGDTGGAFAAFTAANQLRLAEYRLLRDAAGHLYHPAGVAAMTQFVSGADIGAWRTNVQSAWPSPVFLVGFPRSGTTLLDQILSSHSRAVCVEEKDYLSNAFAAVFTNAEKLNAMGALGEDEIETVRERYWREVRGETGPIEGAVVIDKLPLNIVVLPMIRAVFPDAKIIFALRDPRDAVLSCFQHRFGMNVGMAQFLELDRAAAYYDLVMRLMLLCREKLGLPVHQVRYEDVVADLEGEARKLAAFLDLPFESAMLDYRETAMKREIATPSLRQVVQPLYTRSIGRWRRYEAQLAPVLPLLNQWAARFGYGA
ncbi:MAG TPA: sulfotransferase [Vitreimonas sp.]|uniref:tetratricopeptide repeat-containing sulfotransferase family protein n=1 Tax=Vitreimonas sp. TaxID=3069702 RepID=UPI002D2BA40B|nr:sulfotransferase [Vitreimonas sp.]HYD87340.1 sulfotransferase [Vitreimonas sp.]